MPKHYCPSCGTGNEYALTVPKFCNQCGSSFNVAAPAPQNSIASKPSKPKLSAYREDDDDEPVDDGEITSFRKPRKLDVEFEVAPRQTQSLASIMQGKDDKAVFDKSAKRIGKKALQERVDSVRTKLQTTVRHEVGGGRGE